MSFTNSPSQCPFRSVDCHGGYVFTVPCSLHVLVVLIVAKVDGLPAAEFDRVVREQKMLLGLGIGGDELCDTGQILSSTCKYNSACIKTLLSRFAYPITFPAQLFHLPPAPFDQPDPAVIQYCRHSPSSTCRRWPLSAPRAVVTLQSQALLDRLRGLIAF